MVVGTEMKTIATASSAIGLLFVVLVNAGAVTAQTSLEDRYVASRDAAIKKLKPLYDAGGMDDAATEAEGVARADLEAQLRVILGPLDYAGFGPGKLNLGSLYVMKVTARSTAYVSSPKSEKTVRPPAARIRMGITSRPKPTSS